jgi:hypothetical protein
MNEALAVLGRARHQPRLFVYLPDLQTKLAESLGFPKACPVRMADSRYRRVFYRRGRARLAPALPDAADQEGSGPDPFPDRVHRIYGKQHLPGPRRRVAHPAVSDPKKGGRLLQRVAGDRDRRAHLRRGGDDAVHLRQSARVGEARQRRIQRRRHDHTVGDLRHDPVFRRIGCFHPGRHVPLRHRARSPGPLRISLPPGSARSCRGWPTDLSKG